MLFKLIAIFKVSLTLLFNSSEILKHTRAESKFPLLYNSIPFSFISLAFCLGFLSWECKKQGIKKIIAKNKIVFFIRYRV